MAKRKSWFNFLKRLFIPETHSKLEKKDKRSRWVFGRRKIKRLTSNASQSISKDIILTEAEEEQSKHAIAVAVATAAAAEAAITSAQVAAEVVRLTNSPQFNNHHEEYTQIISPAAKFRSDNPQNTHKKERDIKEIAAIRIQTAYRGYLARKALRALKGLVRLQAIIRGRLVRKQTVTTLKCLQSVVNIQSRVCAGRFQSVKETWDCDDSKQLQDSNKKEINVVDLSSQRRWEDTILSKEEATALYLSKKEAMIKRERVKEYSFNRHPTQSDNHRGLNGKWRNWLEQWVDHSNDNSDVFFSPNASNREELIGRKFTVRSFHIEESDSPIIPARRSFQHKKQKSFGDDNSLSKSPAMIPTYMASTESANAKVRSMSLPKPRPGSFDSYSEANSPYKDKLFLLSSINSEVSSSSNIEKQRSPSLKNFPGPLRSNRSIKDLNFESDCSLMNWRRHRTYRH